MTDLAGTQITSLMETLPGIARVLRSPVADAFVNLIKAASGQGTFAQGDAEEVMKYAVRRNLMAADEAERIIAEAHQAVVAAAAAARAATRPAAAAKRASVRKPAAKKPAARKPAAKTPARNSRSAAKKPAARPAPRRAGRPPKPASRKK